MKVLTIALILAFGVTAQQLDKAQIESIVRAYILEHPEVLLESVRLHEQRQVAAAAEKARTAVTTHEKDLVQDKETPWLGADAPEATVVQFFDYRCGYCKRMTPILSKALKEPGVRIVYKEFPILGPDSLQLARLALAAHKQGKYREVHEALMASNGSFTPDMPDQIAAEYKLDAAKLKKDMESPEIAQALAKNQALAMELDIRSTPTFIIGSEIAPGAMDAAQLSSLIERARKRNPVPKP